MNFSPLDVVIAAIALVGDALAIILWARSVTHSMAHDTHLTHATDGFTPTRDHEPRVIEDEPVQYLVMLPSQYPPHLSALSIVPMQPHKSQQHRVTLRDYWRTQR